MEDLDPTIWNRRRSPSHRRTNLSSNFVNWKNLSLIIAAHLLILSSYVDATTTRPVLHHEKIGFAGQLRDEDPNLPKEFSSDRATNSQTRQTSSSSNQHGVTARAPLFQSQPRNQQSFSKRRLPPPPAPSSPSPSASSASLSYHPNHRYPDQPIDFDTDKYVVLKKQPTSSIIAETAYYSPARLELDEHVDQYVQKPQYEKYEPRPSPTPYYRKIYRESPSASSLPVLTSFYTKKPKFEDAYSTPHPEPKKYAFAYAVGDRHRGDDYSHRESRDGQVTMGEYKVLLPDGRLQIVRYTADAKAGFKADVTYEGEKNSDEGPGPSIKPYTQPKAPYYSVGPSGSPDLRKRFIDSSPSPSPDIYAKYQNSNAPYQSFPSISPSIIYKGTDLPQSSKNISPFKSNEGPNAITPTPFGFLKNSPNPSSPSFLPKSIYDKIASTKSPSPYSPIPRGFPAGPSSPKPKLFNDDVNRTPSNSGPRRHRKIIDVEPTKNYIPNSTPGGKSRLIPIEHFKAGPYTDSPKEYPKIFRIKSTPTASYNSPPNQNNNHNHPQEDHYLLIDHHDDHHHPHPSPNPFNSHLSPSPTPYDVRPSPTPFEIHQSPGPTPFELRSSPSPSSFPFDHHRSTEHYNHLANQNFISPTPYHGVEQSGDSKIPPVKSSLATFTSILGVTPKPVLYIKSKPPPIGVGRAVKPSVGGLVYLETPARGIRPNQFGVKDYLDRLPQEFDLPRPKTTTHPYQIGSKDYGESVSYGISGNKEQFTPSQEDPSDYLIPTQLNTDHFRAHHESAEHHLRNQQQFHHHHDAPEIKKVEHHHLLVSYPEQNHQ